MSTLDRIAADLARPDAFPWPADAVRVVHTHTSLVFLAGDRVVKLKKPVDFGFLDYSTVEKRAHFCDEEVRLNRRLAEDVYLGVVTVRPDKDGRYVVDASNVRPNDGLPADAEPAVLMRRIDEARTLRSLLDRGAGPDETTMRAIGRRLAAFHAEAARSECIAGFGSLAVVGGNARENFEQTADHVPDLVSESVWTRCRDLTERALSDLAPLIEARADASIPCETHGDLRLDHVVLDGPGTPDADNATESGDGAPGIRVIDCIEFNERFRFADPVADIAFLSMELRMVGRADLARALESSWAEASPGDSGAPDVAALMRFYIAYRSVVRAKVRAFLALDESAPDAARDEAVERLRAHWLLALGTLSPAADRPVLALTCGLPGAGKTTVARGVAERARFALVRTDEVRKQVAGLDPLTAAASPFGMGLYTPESTEYTYATCLSQAESALLRGERVLVDGTFRTRARRDAFAQLARRLAVPFVVFCCETDDATAEGRLAARSLHGSDASDADASIRRRAKADWERPTGPDVVAVDTTASVDEVVESAVAALRVAASGW